MPTDTLTFHECTTTTSIKAPRQQTVPLRQAGRAKRRGWIKRKTNHINEKPPPNPHSSRDAACSVRKDKKHPPPPPCVVLAPCLRGRVSYKRKTEYHQQLCHSKTWGRVGRSKHKKRQCIICTDGTLSFIIQITSC